MTAATPPCEFLCEVADLADFIDDVLAMPRGSRWHWPSFYLLYVEVDRLGNLLTRTGWLFAPPLSGDGETVSAQEQADAANALFEQLGKRQQALVGWLMEMWRNTRTVSGHSAAHDRLAAHFHPKSGWYQLFRRAYCAGRVSVDGARLERTVLGVDAGSSREHIPYSTAECMIRRQVFDLGASGTKAALAHAADQAGTRLAQTLAGMSTLLREHCTIEDLLHPSSRQG